MLYVKNDKTLLGKIYKNTKIHGAGLQNTPRWTCWQEVVQLIQQGIL